jgi:hypothetical protein
VSARTGSFLSGFKLDSGGTQTVVITVEANQTTSSRTGIVGLSAAHANGTRIFESTVTQLAVGGRCITAAPPTVQASSAAQTVSISVTSACTSAWSATTTDTFISIGSPGGGTGSGTVTLSLQANTSGQSRTGTVAIGDATVTVTQAGS